MVRDLAKIHVHAHAIPKNVWMKQVRMLVMTILTWNKMIKLELKIHLYLWQELWILVTLVNFKLALVILLISLYFRIIKTN